ncbi:galactose-6-phosphate isomerase [Williamsoniiplasma luminosum]|uniref:Galactose-6-phosphate isomerase n=1 Tax=Williamsoniiplasma luminosum TaxID=214888 RepID=A0A2K8NUP4_9MOLU|nr:galactose-6-phosphate isomerase subunit LacB [Williamsoniiplasma luminosum]ATZ17529.1 galactose-6-phosphate isomerase [Williamsoniiplasma luminosum]AVP49345.1 MAG: galactose-6-phosphate isomerase subunit LacB [Williamsoniiplasma luminosum]
MKIAIGCDHIVTDVKDKVKKMLENDGHEVIDCGTFDFERTHYPIFGRKVAMQVNEKKADFGVAICGTGVGISNAVQKTFGARTVLVRDAITAIDARKNYDANVISFGGAVTGTGLIYEIIKKFISTKYEPTPAKDELIKKINSLITVKKFEDNLFDEELTKWDKGLYHD